MPETGSSANQDSPRATSDFLAYGNWFIGNIADIVIVTAAIAGALLTLRSNEN
jgi:hypothetical protein